MNFLVEAIRDEELSELDCLGIMSIINAIWPRGEKTTAELAADMYKGIRAGHIKPDSIHYLVRNETGAVIGHANGHGREIMTADGKITILAICGVCVIPEYRKFGVGALMVRAAFERVDDGIFPLSLFQTSVPGFYEKLGAKQVTNKFVNSLNADAPDAIPWWDPNIMVYPAKRKWSEEAVDLLGPGW